MNEPFVISRVFDAPRERTTNHATFSGFERENPVGEFGPVEAFDNPPLALVLAQLSAYTLIATEPVKL